MRSASGGCQCTTTKLSTLACGTARRHLLPPPGEAWDDASELKLTLAIVGTLFLLLTLLAMFARAAGPPSGTLEQTFENSRHAY